MIDVRDLMIGNYVINENSVFQLRLTDDCELVWHFVGSKDFHFTAKQAKGKMKPIPITPEWLERLGFERIDEYTFVHADSEPSEISVYGNNDRWRFSFEDEMGIDKALYTVWHVHQLQRHFYDATGSQLTLGGEACK